MGKNTATPNDNRIANRPRVFAAAVSRRNKRRAQGKTDTTWPVVYTDILVFAMLASVLSYFYLDEWVAIAIRQAPSGVTEFFRLVTDIGKSEWILIPSGLLCLVLVIYNWQSYPGRRQVWMSNLLFDSWFLFVAVFGSGLLVNVIKITVGRARPKHLDVLNFGYFDPFTIDASFASFPSGHATTVAALATVLALRFPKYLSLVAIPALVIGISRVFVGAHYPSDVIMGLAIGSLFTLALARNFAVRETGFRFVSDGAEEMAIPRRHIIRGADSK